MRDLQAVAVGNAADFPGKYGKPFYPRGFLALFKEQLHAKANAQKRPAARDEIQCRLPEPGLPQGSRGIPERTDARQNSRLRPHQPAGVVGDFHLCADKPKCVDNAF